MKKLREPVNVITHLVGAVLSLIALVAMLIKASVHTTTKLSYGAIIAFGISMILLYTASSTYHAIIASDKIIKIFKKIDHCMIFILITGSYAPYCLIGLNNKTGYILFAIVAISSLLGIIFKLLWVTCPRWISSTIYIFIGWFAVFVIYPLSKAVPFGCIFLLFFGGLMYTIGGVIYALKKDKIKIGIFGTHEIFHVFILLGTLCHFISIFAYIV